MNTDDWEKIFDAIESDNSLSEYNVIDKIKEKLQDTSIVYTLWEMDNFNINYKFTMKHTCSSSKKKLAGYVCYTRVSKNITSSIG